ncbi:hypothetical protein ILP97_44670 [Amycolatopsis sp. H6(2020)]|nr:hypothetical protein [Amycolatopsis sp. H6(2020)]
MELWTTRQLVKKFDSNVQEMRSFLRAHYPDCLHDGRYQIPASELSNAWQAFQRWKTEYSPTQRKIAKLQVRLQERIAGRTNTAKQIAAMFGTSPERLRVFLREMYPDHQGQWRFTSDEVQQIREALAAQSEKPKSLPRAGDENRSDKPLHTATKMTKEDRIRAELAGEVEIDDDPYIRVWKQMDRLLGSQLPPSPPQVKRRAIGQ